MNGNRGQYTSAPLNNMKNRQRQAARPQGDAHQPSQQRFGWLALVLSLVLPILFLLALLIPSSVLRWIFLAGVGAAVAAMWLMNAFVRNARSTLTLVYLALAVVIGLALLMGSQAPEVQLTSDNVRQQDVLFGGGDASQILSQYYGTAIPQPEKTPVPVSQAQMRMEQFLDYWANSSIPDMLLLCTPSWTAQYQDPERELFQLLSGSRPEAYEIEEISGSDGDSARTLTMKVMLDPNNGTPMTLNRLRVLMFKVNNNWYVDPQSLKGTPIDEAAEEARKNQPILSSTVVPTATPDPQAEANRIVLYYNSMANGKYYHVNRICPVVSTNYWPLKEFDYSLLNSQQFKHLTPCPECNPPARPDAY